MRSPVLTYVLSAISYTDMRHAKYEREERAATFRSTPLHAYAVSGTVRESGTTATTVPGTNEHYFSVRYGRSAWYKCGAWY